MKNFLILFLSVLTLNCFGAGLTISSLNGRGTNLAVYSSLMVTNPAGHYVSIVPGNGNVIDSDTEVDFNDSIGTFNGDVNVFGANHAVNASHFANIGATALGIEAEGNGMILSDGGGNQGTITVDAATLQANFNINANGNITSKGVFVGNGSGITNATTSYTTNDIVNGSTNVNTLTHAVLRTIPVKVSAPAATLGAAEIDAQLFVGSAWVTVAQCEIAGGATSIIATNKETLVVVVPSGGSLRLTNLNTSGTGYVAGLDAGATNTYTILP